MAILFGGDQIRRDMAASDFAGVGLNSKAADALVHVGVLSVKDLLDSPWSDEEAGRRFVSLQWRLSVSPLASAKLLNQIEACRARLLEERHALRANSAAA